MKFIFILGNACLNAVFYGRKVVDAAAAAANAEKDKEAPSSSMSSSSSSGCTIPTTTRKHILTVSTYQVLLLLYSTRICDKFYFNYYFSLPYLDVHINAV